MATSGSYDYNNTAANFITDALLHIGVLGSGETVATAKQTEALRKFNYLLKWLAGRNLPLWSRKRGAILPTTGQNYIANGTRTVAWNGYNTTTLAADAAASQADFTVASGTGFGNGYVIGIEQDDGTMIWSTQDGAGSSPTFSMVDNFTAAASSGNRVYVYDGATASNLISTPLQIYHANILDNTNNARWPINLVAESDYYGLGDLTVTGTPNQMFFDSQLNTATFWWYPRWGASGSLDQIIEFTYRTTFQDLDTVATDTLDIPQAFHLPVMMYLASLLGRNYGLDRTELKDIRDEAEHYYQEALGSVTQTVSLMLEPKYEGMPPYGN